MREEHVPHLLKVNDLGKTDIDRLLEIAAKLESRGVDASPPLLNGCIVGLVFGAPSIRTHSSFQAAAMRLGGRVLDVTGAHGLPYIAESIADVIRSIDSLCQILIVRHSWSPSPMEVTDICRTPIINAGQMHGEHPTQALADLYTLRQVFGSLDHLAIGLVVDDPSRREVTSLRHILAAYPAITLQWFISEEADINLPQQHQIQPLTALPTLAKNLAAVYVTPSTNSVASWAHHVARCLRLAVQHNPELCLLHPLPRGAELPTDLDHHLRSAYFREAQNGLWVRQAVLGWALDRWETS